MLQSRVGKDPGRVDWDVLAARWDVTLGGQLASIAPAVSNVRGASRARRLRVMCRRGPWPKP